MPVMVGPPGGLLMARMPSNVPSRRSIPARPLPRAGSAPRSRRGDLDPQHAGAWRIRTCTWRALDMHGNEVIIIVCLVLGVWLTGQGIRLLAIEGGR